MIKFFRRFRQQLLSENKFSKYLVYAIGEIILVVIGILIALQINNWNEGSKERQQEYKLLKQLKTDLTENETEIKDLIKEIKVNKWAMDSILKRLKRSNNPKIGAYITFIHRNSFFNNSNSGYKILGNGMSKLISNDSLLNSILQLYEKDFPNIKIRENLMNSKIENQIYPLTNQLFKINPNVSIRLKEFDAVASEIYTPLDYEALSNNHQYINSLLQLNKTVETRLTYLPETEKKLAKVIEMLNLELNQHD